LFNLAYDEEILSYTPNSPCGIQLRLLSDAFYILQNIFHHFDIFNCSLLF